MMKSTMLVFAVLLSGVSFVLSGCNSTTDMPKKTGSSKVAPKGEHDHDHDHAHHGPHGGEIAEVGKEQYHLEWTHDDASGKVTLYVLDSAAKKEVPIAMPELMVSTKHGDNAAADYMLTAVDAKDGKSAQFHIVDKELLGTIEALSDTVTAAVKELDVNGDKFENVPLAADHHHH